MTNNEKFFIDAVDSMTAADLIDALTPAEIGQLADVMKRVRMETRWASDLRMAKAIARAAYGRSDARAQHKRE